MQTQKLTKKQAINILSYISTKFFRYLVSVKKKTQNGPRQVYQFVPLISFDEKWNDQKLYERYNLNESQIRYIEESIKEIDLLER